MERKGFGIRLGAWLIDFVIMIVLAMIIGLIFAGSFSFSMGTPNTAPGAVRTSGMVLAGIVGPLLGLAYASLDVIKAQTLGKMVLGIKIMDQTGAPATQNALLTRFAVKYSPQLLSIVAAIPGLGFVGLLSMLAFLAVVVGFFLTLGQNRQALHDILAKTAVFGAGTAMIGQGFQPVMPGQAATGTTYAPPPGAPTA